MNRYTVSGRDSGGFYHVQDNGSSIAMTKSRKAAAKIVQALDVETIAGLMMRDWNESVDECSECGEVDGEHDPEQFCGRLWAAYGGEAGGER